MIYEVEVAEQLERLEEQILSLDMILSSLSFMIDCFFVLKIKNN